MPELFDTKYFRGQGPLLMGTRSAVGEPENLIFVGDLGGVEMEPKIDYSKVIENVTGQGGVGSSSLTSVEYNIKIMMRSVKPTHLAMALQGTATTIAGGSTTGQQYTARLGKFLRMAHVKISSVVITNIGGTVTYAAGTDYLVHGDQGLIEILSTGTITEGLGLDIDYAFAAQTKVTTNPGNTDRYIVFAGKNTANNDKQTRCEIYKVRLDPGAPGLITAEETEYSISGRVLQDSLRPAGDQFFKWVVED